LNGHTVSRVFLKNVAGERPESPLFTPCFRLSVRTGMRQSICP
jgi:hypothetical protein